MSHPGADHVSHLLAPLGKRDLATLAHLLECRLCRVRLRPELAERMAGRSAAAADLPGQYDALWERLEKSVDELAGRRAREESAAAAWLADFVALPEAERQTAIETDERFRSWMLAQQLLETGRDAGRSDPAAALERFNLALALADRLDPEGEGAASGIVARAHCYLAESLAASGDLAGAEAAFQHAALHLEASADPLDRAWFCHLLSRMRAEQGRGDEAIALAGRAATLFAGVGQTPEAATALLDEIRLLLEQL